MHTPRPAWVKVGQCRPEALFKKQQQLHDGQQAKAEYPGRTALCSKRLRDCGRSDWLAMRAEDNPLRGRVVV